MTRRSARKRRQQAQKRLIHATNARPTSWVTLGTVVASTAIGGLLPGSASAQESVRLKPDSTVASPAATVYRFDIPAGPLAEVLRAFDGCRALRSRSGSTRSEPSSRQASPDPSRPNRRYAPCSWHQRSLPPDRIEIGRSRIGHGFGIGQGNWPSAECGRLVTEVHRADSRYSADHRGDSAGSVPGAGRLVTARRAA